VFVSRPPPCTGGIEARGVSAGRSIVEMAGSVREEPEAEHHLRVEKAHDSLRSYLTKVLGPRVGSGTIIRGTLKAPNSQLVTPISIKLQRPDGCD
jgi:hypothetical protein